MQLSKNHPGILRPKAEGQGKVYTGASHPAADQPGLAAGLVGVPGVEPGTSSLSGTRSNQLSYTPFADTPAPTELCPRWIRTLCRSDLGPAPSARFRSGSCLTRIARKLLRIRIGVACEANRLAGPFDPPHPALAGEGEYPILVRTRLRGPDADTP
jgi:hypothetical protein